MITYNDIYEAARKERYSDQLQKLPKNFIFEVSAYLESKKQVALQSEEDFSDVVMKTKKQLENARTLFRELLTKRRKKILDLVLIAAETGISKQDFENMLDFEKELFEELMKCMDASDKKLSEKLNSKVEDQSSKNSLIVFLDKVEEFVDMTGNKVGPFDEGQMANLPKEIVKILVDDKKAQIVEE